MRILHVNKFLHRRGGAESYMLGVAQLQREAGHQVEFWGMHHPDDEESLPLAGTFPPFVQLDPAPRGLGGVRAAARMIWSTSSMRGIAEALRQFRPDVVHCHNIYHQLSPSILRPVRNAGIPCVMTLHDYKLACPSYQMLDNGRLCQLCVTGGTWHAVKQRCKDGSLLGSGLLTLESGIHRQMKAYSAVNVFVTPSRFLSDVMIRSGIDARRLRIISNFVDAPAAAYSDKAPGRIVFVGRLSPEKGVDTLIEAMRLTAPGTHLDIAGDGPAMEALERLAKTVTPPGRVVFHGRLASGPAKHLIAGATAMVVPSRWYENQPMTILESFAEGVPVVASELGGIPELVRDGVEGLLVPPEDPPALARAISRLIDDPAWAARLGRSARDRLQKDFSPSVHLARIADVYHYARELATDSMPDGTTHG